MCGSIGVIAQNWTDSVYLKIENAGVGSDAGGQTCLSFDINIVRPNADWNGNGGVVDTDLGISTLCFKGLNGDLDGIFKSQSVIDVNPLLQSASGSYLGISSYFVRGRFYITLKETNQGGALLNLELKKTIKLCRVSLVLRDPTSTQFGLVWDDESTSVMTRKNCPTIESYFGEVVTRPGKFIQINSYSPNTTVCEGSNLVLFAHANTTGTGGLTYEWSDSIPGVRGRNSLGKQSGPVSRRLNPVWGCDYEICGKGDTLKIYNASAKLDTVIFKCVAQDLSLGGTEADNSRSVEIKLWLRDAFYAYLTDYDPSKLFKKADTIYRCPGADAKVRIMVGGMESLNEYKEEGGTIYVRYVKEFSKGGSEVDTVKFNVNMLSLDASKKMYGYNKDLLVSLSEDGCYYVDKVWSENCSNATPYPIFDTVFVKQRNFEVHTLDPVTLSANQMKDITPMGVTWTKVENNNIDLGTIVDGGSNVVYMAGAKAGTDTVVYTKVVETCNVKSEQQINIISEKYLSINVMLEGPYKAARDSMVCVYSDDFPPVVSTTVYESPYDDKKTINRPFPKFDRAICDWIYIELWDYPPYGTGIEDTRRGHLIDSTSALLLSDGTVCSAVKAEKFLTFSKLQTDKYYVVVKHRGHLSVMSKEEVKVSEIKPLVGAFPMIDFSGKTGKPLTSADEAFDNEAISSFPPLKNINGRNLMYQGNVKVDGKAADITINASDIKAIKSSMFQMGYKDCDFNFDGTVNATDLSNCKLNVGKYVKY